MYDPKSKQDNRDDVPEIPEQLLSREQDEAPIAAEARGPVGPCHKTSLALTKNNKPLGRENHKDEQEVAVHMSTPNKKAKVQKSLEKVMFVFRDCHAAILTHYLEKDQAIIIAYYGTLMNKVRDL
ncbi:hypothetical protein TNCV_4814801 [Trichonephila clavipes]|nr:hypothetical protein TNCV_4814801 [Trichonephila clavipes]